MADFEVLPINNIYLKKKGTMHHGREEFTLWVLCDYSDQKRCFGLI